MGSVDSKVLDKEGRHLYGRCWEQWDHRARSPISLCSHQRIICQMLNTIAGMVNDSP